MEPVAMAQSNPTRDGRDAKLWSLLPHKDDPYDFDRLSEAETAALVETLADGYGYIFAPGRVPLPLPAKVRTGLVTHFFYERPDSGGHATEWDYVFWNRANGEAPSPYEMFPLHFDRRRLRVYFQNQFDRFCLRRTREMEPIWAQQVCKDPTFPPFDHSQGRRISEREAAEMLYQKPWYELHALYFLYWIESDWLLKYPKFALSFNVDVAGQLGRLVEQYYWRFRFEKAALTGIAARKGASAGGQARVRKHHAERRMWQEAASQIWARWPKLSKKAVAEKIRKQLGAHRSPKHIARYLKHS
jgi:hypothetical protein